MNTIRGQVYDIIKQGICSGEYKPGQWLQENELAAQFSVSRSPVREALRQLASDGLVIEVPNKGVFVREFSATDIEEIFDLRVMMENYAIEKTAGSMTDEKKQQLQSCLAELEQFYQTGDLSGYIEADKRLHDLFVKLSGNSLLNVAYERVHSMIQQFRIYSLKDQLRHDESIIEHRAIVQAITENRPADAQRYNSHHLEMAKRQIITYLDQESKKQA